VRRYFSIEKIQEYLRLQIESGKNVRVFCREQGLCSAVFYRWRKVYGGQRTGKKPVFREVSLPAMIGNDWGAEISLGTGTTLRVKSGSDLGWVGKLLSQLTS
jgi:hypothetical protein